MEQPVNEAQHPLENPLVLDRFFYHVKLLATVDDWKNIRAVCKTWFPRTLSKWRATALLNLKLGPPLDPRQPESFGVSMSEYLTLVENEDSSIFQFSEKPFQKYKLQNQVLDIFNVNNDAVFTTLIGPNIKHLTLHEVNIKTLTNTMKEIMEFLVNQIPNLENFAVSSVYIEGERINQPPRENPVGHPNVKTLSITKCHAFGFANFPNLQEATIHSSLFDYDLKHLVDSNSRNELRINSSITRLNVSQCSKFSRVLFTALKHISMERYTGDSNDLVAFSSYLQNHEPTLETVEIFGSLTKFPSEWINLNLSALTELRTWGNVFSNLSFLGSTPNLKVLHLDMYGFEKQEKIKNGLRGLSGRRKVLNKDDPIQSTYLLFDPAEVMSPNLQYFQINFELPITSLEAVAIWMPNLKVLKTVLKKDTFAVVCEKWPKLEHLECLVGSVITNENITGYNGSIALVGMEYLTTFKLHTECNQSVLTDNSVTAGFLQMSKLQDVSICVSSRFTQEAEILLRRGVQNVQVFRNYSSNPLHKNWQCCRDTEFAKFCGIHDLPFDASPRI